ncbi:uncharacterized protein LOC144566622 isoform X2 [Carex rostrata]
MKGPNPAPLPPPLYSHYSVDRRTLAHPDISDRHSIPQHDLLDRRAIPPMDPLDRRTLPQPELIDRRLIAPPDGLERRTIALSDGSIRTYFALPPDPPPFARAYHVLDRLPQPMSQSQPHPNQGGLDKAVGSEGEHERSAQRQSTPSNSKSDKDSERSGAGPSGSKRKHEQEEARSSKREKTGSREKEKEKEKEKGEKGKAILEGDKMGLLDAFLKMSKLVNESSSQKRNYLSDGRHGPLRCSVCPSYERESKDFINMNALLLHAYNAMNLELLVKHRALHKALCVLMGWDPSVEPTNSKGYQRLSPDQAQANRDDLVVWPPTVVIQNTNSSSKKDGHLEGMGNKEMDARLLDLGFTGGKSKSLYGREGHQGVILVRFSETLAGLKEAERLSKLFEKYGQGRKNWIEVQKGKDNNRSSDKSVDTKRDRNQNLVKEYGSGEKRVLYGYLATASELEMFDSDAKKRAVIRSRKESDFPDK